MTIRHNHVWEQVGHTMMGEHLRCTTCLMHKVRLMGGWGYQCEGAPSVGFWDSEEAAMLDALKRLAKMTEPARA